MSSVDFDLISFHHNETQLFGVDSATLGVADAAPLMTALADGFESGKLRAPVIAQRFNLDDGPDAYRAVAAGTENTAMKSYLVSLFVGAAVGVVYGIAR
ncbi:hypothetical protein [Burkholderia sp. WSM2230]|uniref:hypothetical protein n=1 Tax=Burkholderia sp. WSM2230 TaxID=944435 RepID=UPI0004061B29